MAEVVVRMGETAVAGTSGDVLACIGLGSCIGLVLMDRDRKIAALAHVMLPESGNGEITMPGKYADTAIPVLIDQAVAQGAIARRLEAALVGGAAMFAFGAGQDIGARNEAAVREHLQVKGIPVLGAVTGGSKGRTVRVTLNGHIEITVREAGGSDEPLELDGALRVAA